jgi:hypothetical protein
MAWRVTNKKLPTGDKFGALIQAIGFAGKFKQKNLWHKQPAEAIAA